MTSNMIGKMIDLSKEKKGLLSEILKLTKEQKEIIKNEDMDELGKVLSQKDKLMASIDLLDVNFLSLYKSIKEEEQVDSMEKINAKKYSNMIALKEIVAEINDILTETSMIDKENTRIMKSNLEHIKSDLKQVKEVKKAYKGYNYEAIESILIDQKQ